MSLHPIHDAVEHAFDVFHRHPAYHDQQTVTTPGATMNVTQLENDLRSAVTNADQWVHQIIDTHLPQLGTLAKAAENSTLVQVALELAGSIDPQAEAIAVDVLKAIAAKAPAAAQPEPAQPAA